MLPSLSVASDPSAYHTGSQRRPQPDAAPGSPPLERGRFEPSVPLKRDPFDFARHESARTSKLYDGRNDQVLDPASFKRNGAKGLKFINKSVGNSRVDAVASTFRGIRNYARNASVQGLDSEVE
jgi:hypothetical protein